METKGFLLALLVALLSGTAAIFEKASLRDASPGTVFTLRSLFMTSCLVIYFLFTGQGRTLTEVSGRTLFLILMPGAMALVFLTIYFSILKQDLASRVIPIIGAAPLVTVILSLLFLGEPFSWKRILGALLIVGGVALVK